MATQEILSAELKTATAYGKAARKCLEDKAAECDAAIAKLSNVSTSALRELQVKIIHWQNAPWPRSERLNKDAQYGCEKGVKMVRSWIDSMLAKAAPTPEPAKSFEHGNAYDQFSDLAKLAPEPKPMAGTPVTILPKPDPIRAQIPEEAAKKMHAGLCPVCMAKDGCDCRPEDDEASK